MMHRRESRDNVSLTEQSSSCLFIGAPFGMHSFDSAFVVNSAKALFV